MEVIDNSERMMAVPIFAVWLTVTSPHFELVTDAGINLGRRVLADLERVRKALILVGAPAETPLPVRCFVFKKQDEFAQYRPTAITRAFFQSGPDRVYIVAAVEKDGSVARPALFHEYVHLVLHHSTHALPKWTDEGLAEYYSTIEFTGAKALIGKPVARHLAMLDKSRLRKSGMTAEDLARVTSESVEKYDESGAAVFYATAWAAASAYASQQGGRLPLGAEAFDIDRLNGYLEQPRQGRPQIFILPMEATVDDVSDPGRPLTDTDAAVMQIDLLLRSGKREYAGRLLDGIEQKSGAASVLERERALIAVDGGDQIDARSHFERSIGAADADADSFFEYAVFLENTGGNVRRIEQLLTATIARSPNHAEALFLQGRMLARSGKHGQAFPLFERAIAILPREEFFRTALEASREALRRPPGFKDDVRTPASWSRAEGDAVLSGELRRVECLGADARITVAGNGQTIILHVGDPGRVLVNQSTGGQVEFRCGDQQPARPVEVRYVLSTGEVTSLKIQ